MATGTPKWVDGYITFGLDFLKPRDIRLLRSKQVFYANTVVPLLAAMRNSYSNKTAIWKDINEAHTEAQSVVRLFGALFAERARSEEGREELLSDLYTDISSVRSYLAAFDDKRKETPAFAKKIQSAEKSSGVSFEDALSGSSTTEQDLEKGVKGQRENILSGVRRYAPGVYDFGREVLGGFATAALGPFAQIGQIALGGAVGVGKFVGEKIRAHQRRRLLGTIGDFFSGAGESARTFGDAFGRRARGSSDLGGIFGGFGGGSGRRGRSRERRGGGRGRGRREDIYEDFDDIGAGGRFRRAADRGSSRTSWNKREIFVFFDKHAYRAKWTAEVLRTLKKIAKSKGVTEEKEGGGILQDLVAFTLLRRFATGAGAVAAAILALPGRLLALSPQIAAGVAASLPLIMTKEGRVAGYTGVGAKVGMELADIARGAMSGDPEDLQTVKKAGVQTGAGGLAGIGAMLAKPGREFIKQKVAGARGSLTDFKERVLEKLGIGADVPADGVTSAASSAQVGQVVLNPEDFGMQTEGGSAGRAPRVQETLTSQSEQARDMHGRVSMDLQEASAQMAETARSPQMEGLVKEMKKTFKGIEEGMKQLVSAQSAAPGSHSRDDRVNSGNVVLEVISRGQLEASD